MNSRFTKVFVSTLLLTSCIDALSVAVAQDEAVTVTATRRAQSVLDVPTTVSVISAAEIENNFVTDIKDLIQFEPGISVRTAPSRFTAAGANTGRDGNSGFNIRGLEGNRVLIVTDGIRLPDAMAFGGQSVGRGDLIEMDTLKSVEILRGPASALYGSDGMAGAVSFITKDPADYLLGGKSWAVQAKPSYTSADRGTAVSALVAGAEGPWQGMVIYTRRDNHETENQGTNFSANTDRTAPNPQDFSSNSVLAKILYAPSDAHRVRLTYEHMDNVMDANVLTAIAKPPLAATSTLSLLAHDTSRRDRVSIDHRYKGAPEDVIQAASWAAYYQNSKSFQYSNEDRNTAADRLRINTFDNRVFGLTGQVEIAAQTGDISHYFLLGGDVSQTRQESVRDGTVPPAGETFPTRAFPNTDFTLVGVFVQDELKFFDDRLSLFPALRFDYYSLDPQADALLVGLVPSGQSKSRVSPKVGGVFQITPNASVFANYAQGFKAPSPMQVNNAFSNTVANYKSIPNPNLRPETSETVEGGVRYFDDMFTFSGSVFSGEYIDFIDQAQVGGTFTPLDPALFQFINQGKVNISGAEAKAEVRFGMGLGFLGSVSYTHGTATNAGVQKPLDSIDPIKLVGGLTYRDANGVFGGQIVLTHSEGKDPARVSGTLCSPTCFTPPAFNLVDVTGYWNVSENFTLRGGIFNLFDEKYTWWSDVRGLSSTSIVKDSYTQPGRNYGISLTARL